MYLRFIWEPPAQIRGRLIQEADAPPGQRPFSRSVVKGVLRRMEARVKVDGAPLNRIQVTFEVYADGVSRISIEETHLNAFRTLFFLPLLLLRGVSLSGLVLAHQAKVQKMIHEAATEVIANQTDGSLDE